jgi:hypothetical protein
MNYAVEISSGAMIYTPNFIKIGSGIQKVIGGVHIQTHRQKAIHKPTYISFQNKEIRLEN